MPAAWFAAFHRAYGRARRHGEAVVVDLGKVYAPDIVPELADRLLSLEEIRWSLVVGEYEGHLATVTISQNKDTEGFDYKKAFEHVSEHISSQLLTATKKKFATVKAGAKVMNIDLKLAVAA